MYSFSSRVRYSEVDKNGKMTLGSIINYFQDCSTFQSEDIGLGIEYLKEKNRAWILSSWQLVVNRYPMLGEEIKIGTWAHDFNGFCGSRNFVIMDKEGNYLAYANSLWIFMDLKRQRPTKVTEDMLKGYVMESRIDMDYAPRKIGIPLDCQVGEAFPVRKYHIDTNNHVNNGQYIQMAKEFIPEGFEIRQMRAEYKKAAVYGNTITPRLHHTENLYTIALCDEEGQAYAIVEFCN